MSKKSDARTALVEKRILEEQAWAYEMRIVRGLSWHAIRGYALRPREIGGIDRNIGIGSLKDMVAAHRAAQGEIVGTRDERVERRQLEYDELALLARGAISGEAFMPDLSALKPDEYDSDKVKIEKAKAIAMIETRARIAAARLSGDAAKRLLDVRAAEAKMHGDDKPAEIKAEIVSRDAVEAELEAMLQRLPEEAS